MNFTRKPLMAALLAALLAPMLLAGAALAAEPPAQVDFEGKPLMRDGNDVWAPELVGMKFADRMSVYVHLEGPSVLDVTDAIVANRGLAGTDAIEGATLTAVQNEVTRRQAATVDALEAMGATVVGRLQVTLNAVHVDITRGQLAAVAQLPGVKSITRAAEHTVDMDDTRPHIGATRAAEELGLDGEGTIIAVIDTGIDYMHAGLGGSGDAAARAADDPSIIEPGTFPTAKVVGGYDFAGFTYNAGTGAPPVPDMDPIDDGGHGSHVAGIAAGLPTTGAALNMHYGIAPAAQLVSLKVFGQSGSTNITVEAMDWVATHNLYFGTGEPQPLPGTHPDAKIDVINMSLGGGYGTGMADYVAVVERLIEQGVTTVASAGNSGALPFVVGSPSATPKILSVANSFAPGELALLVKAEWEGNTEEYGGVESAGGWTVSLETTGAVTGDLAWYGTACNGEPPAQEVNEKIALIQRGGCAFYDKVTNAATEGAVAVVVFNNAPGSPIPMGCGAPSPCGTPLGIPAVMIDVDSGTPLKELLEGGTAVTVTIDPETMVELPLADVMADSSSRGPGRWMTHIKPQITAPGSNIISTMNGSGNNGVRFSGTSMSGPAVAGVTALLWQRNKTQDLGLAGDDIAALAMNYASPVIKRQNKNTGPREGVTRQGAGLANAYAAGKGMTLVRSHEGLAELSFGATNVSGEVHTYERTLTIHNLSDAAKTYSLDYDFVFPEDDADSGVSLAFDAGDSITVEGGESADVVVTMTLDPATAIEWLAYGPTPLLDEGQFQYHEVDGYMHIVEVDGEGSPVEDGDMIGVPWHTLPRLRACTMADSSDPIHLTGADESVETSWSNECGGSSLTRNFWLAGSDERESNEADAMLPTELDIDHVGVRYGAATLPDASTVDAIEFAVATVGDSVLMFDRDVFIYIDADKDGTFDVALFNFAIGNAVFASVWAPMDPSGELRPTPNQQQWFAVQGLPTDYDLNENVTALWIPVEVLFEGASLDSGDLSFDYAVEIKDGAGDYTLEGNDPIGDQSPDNIQDGGRFHFNQAKLDCLTLMNEEDVNLMLPLTEVELFANESVLAKVGYTCGDVLMPAGESMEFGILSHYVNNEPGEMAYTVRMGMVGGDIEPPTPEGIYLPMLGKNFEPEMDGEPTP